MEDINKLIEIADFLGLNSVIESINLIAERLEQDNAQIILPLVGEFSSGKTTLINALTDSKKLETATKPTTSTIYEVHFGCETCHATIVSEQGDVTDVENIADLKNELLGDALVVTVFDTSNRVPSSTILVDTPGLSSPDPKHKQTLVNFLPKADGILLIVDINQQITRSLLDFIDMMKLSRRNIYLVLTKCDTKSKEDIDNAKKYICENCQIPVKQIALVSSSTGNLQEFYSLIDNIQKNKENIIRQVDEQRIVRIKERLIQSIDEMLEATKSNDDINDAINHSQSELTKIKQNVETLLDSITDEIKGNAQETSKRFEEIIFARLNALVAGKSKNYDSEAISAINNTATLLTNEYKKNVRAILYEHIRKLSGTENEIPLDSLDNYDLSSYVIGDLNYNLDLNTTGHEYDGWIKTGVVALFAVGAFATASSAGTAVGTVTAVSAVGNAVDTVSDVGSIISNRRTINKMEKIYDLIKKQKYEDGNPGTELAALENNSKYNIIERDKGMIDSMIGLATDNILSKPQRMRAIRTYLSSSLVPEFNFRLTSISQQIVNDIRYELSEDASYIIKEKEDKLKEMQDEYKNNKGLYDEKRQKLSEYKTLLLNV